MQVSTAELFHHQLLLLRNFVQVHQVDLQVTTSSRHHPVAKIYYFVLQNGDGQVLINFMGVSEFAFVKAEEQNLSIFQGRLDFLELLEN